MFSYLLSLIASGILKLRYRVRLHGLENICRKDSKGILLLPNHPAMVDPAIVGSVLIRKFHPWMLVSETQIQLTVLKHLVKTLKLLPLPDLRKLGQNGVGGVQKELSVCSDTLKRGENVLMYPAGHIYRSRYEELKGNAGVHLLLQQCPETRIVLVRTTGLWGSSFSRSAGGDPEFMEALVPNIKNLLLNLIFFSPRRKVDITFHEAVDFPRNGTKEEQNRYMEHFYNEDAPANTYVPYTWWERGGVRTLPEPSLGDAEADTSCVPPEVREKVFAKLRETASVTEIGDQSLLGADLGMDSLMILELCTWIQQEFGKTVATPDSLRRAGDVLLGAMGKKTEMVALKPVPPEWFQPADGTVMTTPDDCENIAESFLKYAAANPEFPLLADQSSGVLTNRKIVLSILALQDEFARLPGDRVAVIMPACAPFFVIFMALLFAGKTPVLLNWTVGPRNLEGCVRKSEVQVVLSSKLVIEGLEAHGTDFSSIKEKILCLEDLKKNLTLCGNLLALFRSRFCWRKLRTAKVPETVAVLFTSGSESEPKAVPLTHKNCMANVKYAIKPITLRKDECMLGMLPPFHSFGLLISVMLPALTNMRTVFHSNPTEGALLAKLIAAYRATMIVGTPTFAEGILARAAKDDVKSIRIIVTGAEKCPQSVLNLCHEQCPDACFLEGYGITECSPIVSLNSPGAVKANSIGHVLECLDWMICGEDGSVLPANQTGMLYVSGPSIFNGYLAYDGPSPFTEKDGKKWYRTGDLVEADDAGFITFKGRLKRFIKVAGEMVSLPAVEDALLERCPVKTDAPPFAIEAAENNGKPEIVLFSTIDMDKNDVNKMIREAGFSPIHYVERIVKIEEIPLLGTGKTDYRKLKGMI